jgi:ATP/maltotriose-dependent transcriptional regulator MalT
LSEVAALDILLRARLQMDDIDGATLALAGIQQVAETVEVPFVDALTAVNEGRLLAATGQHYRGASRLEDAVDLFDRIGMPYEAAHARIELADVWRTRGHPELADVEHQRARAALLSLGAESMTDLSAPGTEPPDFARPLTPREREVLTLVARGLSDREIAAELGLSEHTIHRHIANVLTKLALPSRAAAVAHATRLGLI